MALGPLLSSLSLKFIRFKGYGFSRTSAHGAPSMAKQPCVSDRSTRASKRDYDRLNIDALLESLFSVSDVIDASFDGLVESRSTDSHQNDFIQRVIDLSSVLLEAGKRYARKRYSVHNASVWPLPPDLTIKVFSMLDMQSVFSAAATCWFFQKCAADPSCYTDITLLPKFKRKIFVPTINAPVSTMIERAGNTLESIKLGVLPTYSSDDDEWDSDQFRLRTDSPILTGSCLSSLSANGGAPGSRLRSMHLCGIKMRDEAAFSSTLSGALSVCPSLVELKVVNMDVYINRILECVSRHCRLLEHFIFEYGGYTAELLEASVCKEFVLNCPKITTLALQSCQVFDSEAYELVKGFNELKYVDFTGCYPLTGAFLENLATKGGGNSLEVMILRELSHLDEVAVKKFMKALLAGKLRHLRHLDISKSGGLVDNGDDDELRYYYYGSDDDYELRYGVSHIAPSKKLLKQRPEFCLVNEIY